MAEGGLDEIEMDNFPDKYSNYNDSELSDYFNEIREKKDKLYNEHGDNENTPYDVRVKYEKYDRELDMIEEERDIRENKSADLFVDSDNGKIEIITAGKKSVVIPKTKFVESNDDYGEVTDENYNLAFKQTEEIEAKLATLKEFNKNIAENQVRRTKLIGKKVKQLYKKELKADSEVSKEIVNRSFVTDYDSIFFKPIGEKGNLLKPKLIFKKGNNKLLYSKDITSKNAIKQFKELVSKLPEQKKKKKDYSYRRKFPSS